MNFKYYYNGSMIATKAENTVVKKNKFHMEIMEALEDCVVNIGCKNFVMARSDIIISPQFSHTIVHKRAKFFSKPVARFFEIEIVYPSPLNQHLMADNALIHDLMNDKQHQVSYILFKNLQINICHNYLNILKIICENKKDKYYDFQAQQIIGLLFTELLHNHKNKISKSNSSFPSKDIKYAGKDSQSGAIMSYIADKSGNVSLKEVAHHFGYQKNYFSRLCQKLFGMDFVHLRLDIRINIAAEELRLTNKSIYEISSELGYKDVTSLVKSFAKIKHQTPAAYRHLYGIKI